MSSEHRIVRPYLGVDAVQNSLDGVLLEFGDRRLEPGQRLTVSTTQYLMEPMAIAFAANDDAHWHFSRELAEAVEAMQLDPSQVEVVLLLRSPRLKIAEIAWRVPIKDLESVGPRVQVATVSNRPDALCAPFGGCTADLYVVLTEVLGREPLRPHRRGTWLARVTYKVSTDLGEIGFTPLELTDDVRLQYGLHDETVRFVLVEDPLVPEAADDAISVYLDVEVLARLAANVNTIGSKLFQRQLFFDAMVTVINAASAVMREQEPTPAYADHYESLVARLVRQMSWRGDEVDEDGAKSYWDMIGDDPSRAVAHLEGWIPGFRSTLLDSIGEDDL